MAASSRGPMGFLHQHSLRLPSTLRAAAFPLRPQALQPRVNSRFFTSSLPRKYQYPSSSSARSFISSDPVLRTVVQNREPVLLYKAPQNRLYLWSIYGLASACIGGGLWTWKFRSDLPRDLPFFVGPTYNVVGAILIAIGVYAFTAPVRRISSLEIIPSIQGGPLQLRIRARNNPFFKERVILAQLGEAQISEKTAPMKTELVEAERARKQNIGEGLEGMSILPRMWELAGRWIEQKWTSFFLRFKFAVLRFGIAEVHVHGDKWKIDCSGWLREDGKAIDRIISEL